MDGVHVEELLSSLPSDQQEALRWFRKHAGTRQRWTSTTPSGVRLFSVPKGIYKPKGSEYGLSVRQTLKSKYPDREPIVRGDGTWTYVYHQEGDDPLERDREFTNRGLMRCLEDRVPVGVARQTRPKPHTEYEILGLALVHSWRDGFFQLEGFNSSGYAVSVELEGPAGNELESLSSTVSTFDPAGISDARRKTLEEVVWRRGQARFRRELLRCYGGRCAVTQCQVEAVLEAAHVTPYLGEETNTVQNGILLRADLHALWDMGLVAVDPDSRRLVIARALQGTEYERFSETELFRPAKPELAPSYAALAAHLEFFRQRP